VPRFCHDRLDRSRETRVATPSPGSALGLRPLDRAHPAHQAHLAVLSALQALSTGLPLPLGGLSRGDSCKLGFPPRPQFRRRYAPELSQPVARPRPSLGFALQSFPFPGSRAAFRRPSASLRVRRRPCLRREDSLAVRPVSTTRLVLASLAAPREEDTRSRHWTRERDFPAIVKTACPPRELPRTTARRPPQKTFGLAGTRPFRPLRSLAPPGSPFTRPTAKSLELAPEEAHGRPGRCSPGFCPSRAFSVTTSGSVDCTNTRRRSRAIAKVTAPFRTTEPWLRS